MRNWSFTFNNDKEYSIAGKQLMDMFQDTKEYKEKKIIICGMEDGDDRKIYMSIEDTVPGSYIVSIVNAFDKNVKNVFTCVKAGCKDINVELPSNCKINSWWEEDLTKKAEFEKANNITNITNRS